MRALRTASWIVLVLAGSVGAAKNTEPRADDEKRLVEAGIELDNLALLDFFRNRTLKDTDRPRLGLLVKQLGDDDFAVREAATRELMTLGLGALGPLRLALKDPDPEVRNRVQRCLTALPMPINADVDLLGAAARVLAHRRPPETVEVLLAYLPDASDEVLQEEVLNILTMLGVGDGKPDEALVRAVRDSVSLRRQAAARCLPRTSWAKDRAAVRRLLDDPDLRVRWQSAQALLQAGDKSGVPTLLALLTEAPAPLALQVEELLRRLAGTRLPPATIDIRDTDSRRRCRDTWTAWWQIHETQLDLAPFNKEERRLGLTAICESAGSDGISRVWECAADGKSRWQIRVRNAICLEMLPEGRVLVADCSSDGQVAEFDRSGKVRWSKQLLWPVSCQRLPNGNTFIATHNELLEVTRGGSTVFTYRQPKHIYSAQKLENGHIVFLHSSGQVIELDDAGEQVRVMSVPGIQTWGSCAVLPSGNYLLSQYGSNRVAEIDPTGKLIWECAVPTPTWASRLANGNTLIASGDGRRVLEFNRGGDKVWEQATQGRPFCARRR